MGNLGWMAWARGTGFGDEQVVLDRELPGSQRLEFDAKSENPGDLTALLNINDSGYQTDEQLYFNAGNAGQHIVEDQGGYTLRAGS